MPDDEDDAFAYQLVCCGNRLIRIAEVVSHEELDLVAEDATLGVEISSRHPGTALELLAEPSLTAGHCAGHTDQDLRPSGCIKRAERRQHERGSENNDADPHGDAPCSVLPATMRLLVKAGNESVGAGVPSR